MIVLPGARRWRANAAAVSASGRTSPTRALRFTLRRGNAAANRILGALLLMLGAPLLGALLEALEHVVGLLLGQLAVGNGLIEPSLRGLETSGLDVLDGDVHPDALAEGVCERLATLVATEAAPGSHADRRPGTTKGERRSDDRRNPAPTS